MKTLKYKTLKRFILSLLSFIAAIGLLVIAKESFSLIALFGAIGCFLIGVYLIDK